MNFAWSAAAAAVLSFVIGFVVHGMLGEGVAAGTRQDPQAKGLGEWLRSRHVNIPLSLLEEPTE